ncbi:MAG: hypothetical protein ACFCGT_09550 [Sandaracinaceae bacterium]
MTLAPRTPPARPAAGSRPLLSHHAIMALVGPFTRRGYRVDLAASDRERGMVAFRAVDLPRPSGRPALQSLLRLERLHRLKFRVTRTLRAADGQLATMSAEGPDPEVLLEVVEEVDPDRQFHVTGAGLVTRSYRTDLSRRDPREPRRRPGRAVAPRLTQAEASLGPVHLSATETTGRALEVRLIARGGAALDLPRDFLAVLGWGWRPLRRVNRGTWVGSVRPTGWASPRTARLEAQLDRAAAHIVETIAAPPLLFHRRHWAARWRAAFQRLMPLLFLVGMTTGIASAVALLPRTQAVHMVVFHAAMLAIVVLALTDRAYRVEVPPPPRPLTQPRWTSDPRA